MIEEETKIERDLKNKKKCACARRLNGNQRFVNIEEMWSERGKWRENSKSYNLKSGKYISLTYVDYFKSKKTQKIIFRFIAMGFVFIIGILLPCILFNIIILTWSLLTQEMLGSYCNAFIQL